MCINNFKGVLIDIKDNDIYYVPNILNSNLFNTIIKGDNKIFDYDCYSRGIIFLNKFDAIRFSRLILAILQ